MGEYTDKLTEGMVELSAVEKVRAYVRTIKGKSVHVRNYSRAGNAGISSGPYPNGAQMGKAWDRAEAAHPDNVASRNTASALLGGDRGSQMANILGHKPGGGGPAHAVDRSGGGKQLGVFQNPPGWPKKESKRANVFGPYASGKNMAAAWDRADAAKAAQQNTPKPDATEAAFPDKVKGIPMAEIKKRQAFAAKHPLARTNARAKNAKAAAQAAPKAPSKQSMTPAEQAELHALGLKAVLSPKELARKNELLAMWWDHWSATQKAPLPKKPLSKLAPSNQAKFNAKRHGKSSGGAKGLPGMPSNAG